MDFLAGEVHIRIGPDKDDEVEIFFMTTELHRMNRSSSESASKMIKRLQSTWTSKMSKSSKTSRKKAAGGGAQQGGAGVDDATTLVDGEGVLLDKDSLTNVDYKTGMRICLREQTLVVVVNAPAVTSLSTFPTKYAVCAGRPVAPLAEVEFADSVEYHWFAETALSSGVFEPVPEEYCTKGACTPPVSLIGCKLKVFAVPVDSASGRKGRAAVFYIPCKVREALPDPAVLAHRHEFLALRQGHSSSSLASCMDALSLSAGPAALRVLTYNILAEPFATSESAIKYMFGYCDRRYLESEYRLQLAAQELLAHAADVVCLQECDAKAFSGYLERVLGAAGYRGVYTNKVSRVREGCALFVRTGPGPSVNGGGGRTLRLLGCVSVPLGEVMSRRRDLQALLAAKPTAREVLVRHLGTVAQLALVEAPPRAGEQCGRLLVVANTHLFYHPGAAYARLLQTDTICLVARAMVLAAQSWALAVGAGDEEAPFAFDLADWESWLDRPSSVPAIDEAPSVPFILCGDLNSTPETAVCEYLEKGRIGSEHEVWQSLDSFRWGARQGEGDGDEEEIPAVAQDESSGVAAGGGDGPDSGKFLPACLVNPHGVLVSSAGYPPFTNYTAGFKDLLDYVYTPPGWSSRVAPFPDEAVLSRDVALPAAAFPSDHLSVCVDLDW